MSGLDRFMAQLKAGWADPENRENVCRACLSETERAAVEDLLLDTGACDRCGSFGEVANPFLLRLTGETGMSAETVWQFAPRIYRRNL